MVAEKVLVGYDGTQHSEHALQFAFRINDDYDTEIHLAFVVQEPAGMADPIPDVESLKSINGDRRMTVLASKQQILQVVLILLLGQKGMDRVLQI